MSGAAPPKNLVRPDLVRDSAWAESVDLLAAFGLELDDWQELILQVALGERTDGKWAAKQVGLSIPRQNGKSQMIVARALAGVLLFGEKKIVVSAHLQDTARETFSKFMDVIENSPELEAQLRGGSVRTGVMNALMRETIKFKNGAVIQFKARTNSGTRGYSSDLLFLDEAQILKPAAWVSINSTMSARPNPQVWLMGTPPTPADEGETFGKIRQSGIDGETTSLAWLEWGADEDDDPKSEYTRWKANPAWLTRINHEVVDGEYASYSPEEFALDRLGIWQVGSSLPRVINFDQWDLLKIPTEAAPLTGNIAFGVKFSLDGSRYGVGVAMSHIGGVHVESFPPIPMGAGITGLADWFADPKTPGKERWRTAAAIVIDGKAGVADLVTLLRARRVPATRIVVAGADVAIAANSTLLRHVSEGILTHLGQEGLDESVKIAGKRVIGNYGGWGFESVTPDGDVTPVENIALALHGAVTTAKRPGGTQGRVAGTGRRMGNRTAGTGRQRGMVNASG